IISDDTRIGFFAAANDMAGKLAAGALPSERANIAPQLIFNLHLDAGLTLFFVILLWLIVFDMLRMCCYYVIGKTVPPATESPYTASRLIEKWVRD
ncbi:MAG: carbon starvation protein A, partial [Methylobacter sp.]